MLEQPPLSKTLICFSLNTENQVHSFGVVFRFNRWHISFVEIISITERQSKCQFIMEARILIFVQCQVLSAHSFLKQQALDTNTELIMRTKLQ